MSKIALSGNASGTGTLTIAAPNTSTDRTLTLPDQTGTLLTGSGAIGVNSSAATNSLVIDASGNVGIGTSSPALVYNDDTTLTVNGKQSATSYRSALELGNNGSLGAVYFCSTANAVLGSYANIPLAFRTNNTERARIDSSGNLLYGMTTRLNAGNEGALVQIKGTAVTPLAMENGDNNFIQAFWSKGTTSLCGSIQKGAGLTTSYVTSSDYRAKEDVQPLTGALVRVAALKPVTYKWKVDGSDGEGFIAHELQEVCPAAVAGEKDAVDADGNPQYQGIDTSFLVATLTAAIQELKAIVDAQGAEIAALKGIA